MRLFAALPLALAAVAAAAPAADDSAAARLAGWLRLQQHSAAGVPAPVYADEQPALASGERTLWRIINEDEHFKDLAHVLNYSSSSTKKLLDGGEDGLTLLAPVNWHREHRDAAAFGSLETDAAAAPYSAEPALSAMSVLEQSIAAMHSLSDDDDKERRRRFIQMAIDATLRYHLVASPGGEGLKADTIAQNSSVATRLHVGAEARKYVGDLLAGEPFRVRAGKSLLPRPGVYFNFYSRLVYPDVAAAGSSVLHAVSAPLFIPPSIVQALLFGEPDLGGTTTAIFKLHAERFLRLPHPRRNESHASLAHAAVLGQLVDGAHHHHDHHEGPHGDVGLATGTFFAPSNVAWKRLPPMFKAYLFSPWGERLLAKVLMLHSLPYDAVFADAIYSAKKGKSGVASTEDARALGGLGGADVQTYVFDTALPKIHCPHHHDHVAAKEEMEQVTVKVYRYHILPGGRGPLQTRVEVQGVGVSFQDIPAANGAIHLLDKFIMPAGHGDGKGLWAEVAAEVTRHGYGDGAAALALL